MTEQFINTNNKLTNLLTEYQRFCNREFGENSCSNNIIQNLLIDEHEELILNISSNDKYYLIDGQRGMLELSYNITREIMVGIAYHRRFGKVELPTNMSIRELISRLQNDTLSDLELFCSPELVFETY